VDLRYVSEFRVLAETGNFLDAASDLDISQSTLSRHIQSLEAELGARLFTRSTRRVSLSEYGGVFLPYAKQLLEIERNIRGDFSAERRGARAKASPSV